MLLWAAEDTISPSSWEQIQRADAVILSVASAWEIAIKRAVGRLDAPQNVVDRAVEAGIAVLGIAIEHAQAAGSLPLHHRDPFDRMLVAQARLDGLTLASADPVLAAYDVPVLEVCKRKAPQ